MSEMRAFAKEQFTFHVGEFAETMEETLYQDVLGIMKMNGTPGMDFYPFRRLYKRKLQNILENLAKPDSRLKRMLLEKPEDWETLISLQSKEWERELWALDVEDNEDTEEELREGTFDCSKCARKGLYSRNTSHFDKQTRSADEPSTIFVSCHTCGSQYKFSS